MRETLKETCVKSIAQNNRNVRMVSNSIIITSFLAQLTNVSFLLEQVHATSSTLHRHIKDTASTINAIIRQLCYIFPVDGSYSTVV